MNEKAPKETYLEKRKRLLATLEEDLPLAERRIQYLRDSIINLRAEIEYLKKLERKS